MKKGDPLETARLAGIMAAKQTSSLIPLCHPLPLSHADVRLTPAGDGYDIEARVRTTAPTGVEMEALTAVSVAALTVYDMVKAVDKAMVIGDIRLVEEDEAAMTSRERSRRHLQPVRAWCIPDAPGRAAAPRVSRSTRSCAPIPTPRR